MTPEPFGRIQFNSQVSRTKKLTEPIQLNQWMMRLTRTIRSHRYQ